MITLTRTPKPTPLDEAISELYVNLGEQDPETEEYSRIADQIVKLEKLNAEIKAKKRISPDVAVTVAANLAGILLIINHERLHVVASKAIGFVMKTR